MHALINEILAKQSQFLIQLTMMGSISFYFYQISQALTCHVMFCHMSYPCVGHACAPLHRNIPLFHHIRAKTFHIKKSLVRYKFSQNDVIYKIKVYKSCGHVKNTDPGPMDSDPGPQRTLDPGPQVWTLNPRPWTLGMDPGPWTCENPFGNNYFDLYKWSTIYFQL